jgi:hypothetical protein
MHQALPTPTLKTNTYIRLYRGLQSVVNIFDWRYVKHPNLDQILVELNPLPSLQISGKPRNGSRTATFLTPSLFSC